MRSLRLGLGAAQFGMKYGVTNSAGKPSRADVRSTLDVARSKGIRLLDTAAGYGESEAVLGAVLQSSDSFAIGTKTPDWRGAPPANAFDLVRAAFLRSLTLLKRSTLSALLIHNAEDLCAPNGPPIWDAMRALRDDGFVERIGVSIYDSDQLRRVRDLCKPQIVQLPVNVIDQRLAMGGEIDQLAKEGIEVHVRSAFLQGTLLAEPDSLPHKIAFLREPIRHFRADANAAGLSPLQAALGFVRSLPAVEVAIVGVGRAADLVDIAQAALAWVPDDFPWHRYALVGSPAVDPRTWG